MKASRRRMHLIVQNLLKCTLLFTPGWNLKWAHTSFVIRDGKWNQRILIFRKFTNRLCQFQNYETCNHLIDYNWLRFLPLLLSIMLERYRKMLRYRYFSERILLYGEIWMEFIKYSLKQGLMLKHINLICVKQVCWIYNGISPLSFAHLLAKSDDYMYNKPFNQRFLLAKFIISFVPFHNRTH